ncbi:conserved exported hypothetical protein [Desulfamplus magnetovallimortis]|uniref:Membrane protein involved in aromatic hydrocarbon degradation n=1 Tax=Desulfamplus magnetovallimortis TaxID=1246637 RepID=A0A1W1H5J9_9BACT|nr:hypothetical protein [Desulfamplus magnetovallimortis]SLM27717.1 conserved exported hypothetical protein [Desulfamplus magnetovallimortis]
MAFKIVVHLIFLFTSLFPVLILAEENYGFLERIEITSTPNPVGSGARALGMGGAFIAIADDATAASWNPGGLVQLEKPEISVVFSGNHRKEENFFSEYPDASGNEEDNRHRLNYLSAALPFVFANRNMVLSLNYQHMYDFSRGFAFENFFVDSASDPSEEFPFATFTDKYEFEQDGALYALGLAWGIAVSPDLSFGITLNYWGDFIYENEWEESIAVKREHALLHLETNTMDTYSFEGWNAVLGFLYRLNSRWTLGGVLKMPFKADINHSHYEHNVTTIPDSALPYMDLSFNEQNFSDVPDDLMSDTGISFNETSNEQLRLPMSWGIGLAYRYSDNLSVSLDYHRTLWNDFEYIDADGNKTSPVNGLSLEESGIDPVNSLRMGAEYLIIKDNIVIPVRMGIFYDPAPAKSSPDEYMGFSIGTGLAWRWCVVDVAYQFRYGNDVGTSLIQGTDFSQDIEEHIVYCSLITHF